ncbi:TPA: hypothetical protein ACJT8R_003136, partial [Legionella pneumophila]|nr:hypothetical protein [Legionella pneumophila]HAT8258390.1 hypothetical protein [Legionella pneumophila]HAT8267775.1 hypothetical protein [Legionella pneumophila]HAT8270855.1 hypothetical protein [Legionella pneumophila]HAT8273995.1 hypothetical protein [Legionella pneumophila]
MDWTFNFQKSIYFALGKNPLETPGYLSIFVYEKLTEETSPIIVMPKSHLINNPRAEAQEGTFTYSTKPCSFYLRNNRFPSIDDYYEGIERGFLPKAFSIKKYNLARTPENILALIALLEKNNIN